MPGRTFEGFTVGEVLEHAERIPVQQEDNVAFCRLTHNNQPLHLDEEYARNSPFGKIVVNGLYTFSLAVGVSVEDTTAGTLVANVGYEEVKHAIPVHPGDTLRFTTEVVDKRPSSKPGRGLVTLLHRAFNQQEQEVCSFKRLVLVRSNASTTSEGSAPPKAPPGGRP